MYTVTAIVVLTAVAALARLLTKPISTSRPCTMRKVVVQNEQYNPMADTAVEMVDSKTGDVISRAKTDSKGTAQFDRDAEDGTYFFRPQTTRRSGKQGEMSLGGATHIHEIDPPVNTVTKTVSSQPSIPRNLRGNLV